MTKDIFTLYQDTVALNLAVVEQHFHSEAADEVEKALELFTDDIVWESPARNVYLYGKRAAGENYRRMFASMKVEGFRNVQRFATPDRVVDDSIATVTLVGDGVVNAPVPVGTKVEIRLLHVFEMRDGKIARESVFEVWSVLQLPAANLVAEQQTAGANGQTAYAA
ncbi:MAG TPA: nuclear transport factor 2 family protein [Pyrinomonadaceae bacterium]|nr:nuclear transport factor 2 family protein [Pyrinomonadaceae bacterium]